ncbi:viral A-type inclusion protein, partial [Reticulomyxa filosa]
MPKEKVDPIQVDIGVSAASITQPKQDSVWEKVLFTFVPSIFFKAVSLYLLICLFTTFFFFGQFIIKKKKKVSRLYERHGCKQKELVYIEEKDPLVNGIQTKGGLIVQTMEGRFIYISPEDKSLTQIIHDPTDENMTALSSFCMQYMKSKAVTNISLSPLCFPPLFSFSNEIQQIHKIWEWTERLVAYCEVKYNSWWPQSRISRTSVSVTELCINNGKIYAVTESKGNVLLIEDDLKVYLSTQFRPNKKNKRKQVLICKKMFLMYGGSKNNTVQKKKREQLTKVQKELEDEKKKVKQLESAQEDLTKKNEQLRKKNMENEKDINEKKEKLKRYKTEHDNLESKCKSIEGENKEQKRQIDILREGNIKQKNQITDLEKENKQQMKQITDFKNESKKQTKKINDLEKDMEQIGPLKARIKSIIENNERLSSEHATQKEEIYKQKVELNKYEKQTKQLELDYQQQKIQFDTTKMKLHEYTTINEKYRCKLNSLNLEKDALISKLENCKKQSDELKEYYLCFVFYFFSLFFEESKNMTHTTNAQLSSEVQDLRGRICKLTIGVGIESKFPAVNDIATTYEGISDNYRLSLASEITTQLEDNEKIKEKYAMSFLARFSHCVSFSVLLLSYQF